MKVTSQGVQGTGRVGSGDNIVSNNGRFLATKAAERVISNFGDRAPVYTASPRASLVSGTNAAETART